MHLTTSRWFLFTAAAFAVHVGPAWAAEDAKPPAAAEPGKTYGFKLSDPTGDDKGPGTYTYPTDAVYKPGAFDITEFEVVPRGNEVEFRVTVRARIDDPWDSPAWGGNGFSVQMAFIHIDTDHVKGSGVRDGLPGTNVRFAEDEAWDRVVIISPQPATRVNSEVGLKCPQWKDRIVVPKLTRASGRTLIAVVDVSALGGQPGPGWGYQVLMQSNEGFPAKGDLLTRKVNESEGQHRFGGGSDYDNDPHVMDILVPPNGDPAKKQYEILSKYNKTTKEPKPEDLAVVPMVYPFATK
jgi:carbohydrate-binding DOMON domain-containing protein